MRRSRIPALLLLPPAAVLSGPAPLWSQEADLAEKMLRSGERAYASKAYAEAFETWNQLVKVGAGSPQAAQAMLRMARHHWEVERKPEAALALLDRVKAEHLKDGHAAEALLQRALILATLAHRPSDLQEPVADLNRVLDLFPDHPVVAEVNFQLGLAFRDQGQARKALAHFVEAFRQDPAGPAAPRALLEAAECQDRLGDLNGCLRLLQQVRTLAPDAPEAAEAGWRINLRVKHRVFRPTPRSEGPWPGGRTKWLKTPTLAAQTAAGELVLYQDDLAQAFVLRGGELAPLGPKVPGAKAMLVTPAGIPWLAQAKAGLYREEGAAPVPIPGVAAPSGMFLDRWGTVWLADAKGPQLTLIAHDGQVRTVPSPALNALAPLRDGAVAASDANRTLLILDATGQPRAQIPYGKDMPASFRYVVALATDPAGHVAGLVEGGDFDGVVVWGPDGAVLRYATLRALGISGKFRSLVLDREGGLLLVDRSNDVIVRLN
jgi:tetratricopeptide (TPR) repeat protein